MDQVQEQFNKGLEPGGVPRESVHLSICETATHVLLQLGPESSEAAQRDEPGADRQHRCPANDPHSSQ
eukprot:9110653-Pyramimonas_sp.AAC.1